VPPHHWIPLRSSDCRQVRKNLIDAIGKDCLVRFWGGKKQSRCYALVSCSPGRIPQAMRAGQPVTVIVDDEELEDMGAN
jgi:hypothetical protein